jgi:hypothetical protein
MSCGLMSSRWTDGRWRSGLRGVVNGARGEASLLASRSCASAARHLRGGASTVLACRSGPPPWSHASNLRASTRRSSRWAPPMDVRACLPAATTKAASATSASSAAHSAGSEAKKVSCTCHARATHARRTRDARMSTRTPTAKADSTHAVLSARAAAADRWANPSSRSAARRSRGRRPRTLGLHTPHARATLA